MDAVGSTPLIELKRYLPGGRFQLFAKLEALNPGGSAKDRPAKRMIEEAISKGEIASGTTVVESSSGNMGIGLAQACRYYGLRFVCVVDPHAQQQNLKIIEALGGQIERVAEPVDGSYLAARWARVREIVDQSQGAFWPNQYANQQNPMAHRMSTVREIDESLNGKIDYLFVATSSTGTASGCRDYLRSKNRKTKVIAVDADGSVLFGGVASKRLIPGLGAGKIPPLARGQMFSDVVRVSDLDCVVGCRRMADREAILVGGSGGGVLQAVGRMAGRLVGKTCVAILHDSGTRYLDTVFCDRWVEENLGVDTGELQRRVAAGTKEDGVCGPLGTEKVLLKSESGLIESSVDSFDAIGLTK